MNNFIMTFLPIIIAFSAALLLKILNIIYKYFLHKTDDDILSDNFDLGLIDSKVSYDDFIRISNESLKSNSPSRYEDDFLNFFINNICSNPESIENQLLKSHGEDYE